MRTTLALFAAAIAASAAPPFAGKWTGNVNNLPAIEINLHQTEKELKGQITFFFQRRGEDGKWRVEGATPVQILEPHVAGNTLTFEVVHHKYHGSSELGPNVKFRVQLAGPDEARLFKLDEPVTAPGLKLTRQRLTPK